LFAWRAAGLDRLDNVEWLIAANDDVVAAGVDGITGLHGDPTITIAANYLHAAHDARSVEEAVVQTTFGKPIGLLVIEVRFGEQLPGEKARAVEALQAGTNGTATL